MKDFKEFFSTTEVAKILRISRVAVLKRINSGALMAVKVGRNYVVARDEILKALGLVLGEKSKGQIDAVVRRALKEYGETFRRLGKE
ncbi:MAG: helix-turn-helix domain-containing protein [Patescibacteria group bacterium]|nr:helix-turn-helix domain-containing protein [Patescibacteria group bacterium]